MKPMVVALALVTLPRLAQAQDSRLERLGPQTSADMSALVDSARIAGLPVEPLVDRALEGASKGAPATLILAAVRRLVTDLGRARDVLGADAGPGTITAAADALRAGAPPDVLLRLRDALGHRRLAVPLGVTADLTARGVPPDTAATLVITIARSVADADLLALQRDVERDIALGASPLAAAIGHFGGDVELTSTGTPRATPTPPPARRKP